MGKLRVRVQPGARRNELLGFQEGVLRVKLSAPPVEGQANRALVAVLADLLDVPKSRIAVVSGLSARDKVVEVVGLAGEAIAAQVKARLAG